MKYIILTLALFFISCQEENTDAPSQFADRINSRWRVQYDTRGEITYQTFQIFTKGSELCFDGECNNAEFTNNSATVDEKDFDLKIVLTSDTTFQGSLSIQVDGFGNVYSTLSGTKN